MWQIFLWIYFFFGLGWLARGINSVSEWWKYTSRSDLPTKPPVTHQHSMIRDPLPPPPQRESDRPSNYPNKHDAPSLDELAQDWGYDSWGEFSGTIK